MASDRYEKIIDQTCQSAHDETELCRNFIRDVIRTCETYHQHGLDVQHATRLLNVIALNKAGTLMALPDAEALARFARNTSEATRKITSENWSPPDRKRWPYQ